MGNAGRKKARACLSHARCEDPSLYKAFQNWLECTLSYKGHDKPHQFALSCARKSSGKDRTVHNTIYLEFVL